MLYVFHVDTGRMMTFDMSLALENVIFLKETIERHHAIPSTSIVLLVSGGDMLVNNSRVCSYTAGTDTNPIYMFSTCIADAKNQPSQISNMDIGDTDIKIQVDRCLELPAAYSTVVARAQLALQIHEMAKEEVKVCEKLVHEQHLQQQGWAAVVANMEDITKEFKERCDDFYRCFQEHLEKRDEYLLNFLSNFDEDLNKLAEIPILSSLLANAAAKPFGGFDEVYAENTESFCKSKAAACKTNENSEHEYLPDETLSEKEKKKGLTLLEWISASENQKSLKRMADNCRKSLESFDKNIMENLKKDIEKSKEAAQREDMKEIKGLEDRLYGLEKLMCEAKKCVQDQNELAQSFQQHQNRANILGDASILPDLCASHRSQLLVMLQNHKLLRDIRRRCSKAKDELGENLFQRLKFVIHVENKMSEIDSSLLFYHRCLRRLQKHLGIIEQIHQAPCMYVTAVTEVVRRRMFSNSFLRWASELACRLLKIYNEEVMRRHEFTTIFEGHFLSTLFPGMDDLPPSYAIEAPSIFDSNLPALNKDDIEELSNYLPELTEKIQLPDLDSVIDFFQSRSVTKTSSETRVMDKTVEKINVADGENRPLSIPQHIREIEKGCESETDTEEFEKIGQSPVEKKACSSSMSRHREMVVKCNISTSTETIEKNSKETETDDNLGSTRIEVERLKNILKNMFQLSHETLTILKEQLNNIKSQSEADKAEFRSKIEILQKTWIDIQNETKIHERELVQRLTVDHELEMNDLRKSVNSKDEEIQSLRSDNSTMKASHIGVVSTYENEKKHLHESLKEVKSKIEDLEKRVMEAEIDKKTAIQETIEKLEHKHKTEIESLRCRFKLMTSMDRSPSDTSLEKIERPDMIDIASHEHILTLARQNFTKEMEIAIKTAVEFEKQKWDAGQFQMSCSPKSASGSNSHDFHKRILEEKERQIDSLREREVMMTKENQKYKETIQSLADSDVYSAQTPMKDKLERLEKEKSKLEKDLEKERQHKFSTNGAVSVASCSKGDTVMIVWNTFYEQYIIVQNSPILYFVHTESYEPFNITTPVTNIFPKVSYCIGVVVDKDYCIARKDENRYKVSRGTQFYRVKVRPRALSKTGDFEKCSHKKGKSKFDSQKSLTSAEKCSQPSGLLIDSFAQTELQTPILEDNTTVQSSSRDMIDSGVVEQQKSVYKERNISVTEDDYPGFLLTEEERSRYESVNEEDELSIAPKAENMQNAVIFKDDLNDSDEYRSLEAKEDDTEEHTCAL